MTWFEHKEYVGLKIFEHISVYRYYILNQETIYLTIVGSSIGRASQ